MKYTLNEGVLLRREWFGCLAFHSYNGHYWQFNSDAFEILRHLKAPILPSQLQRKVASHGLTINEQKLCDFLDTYEKQGLISKGGTSSDAVIFYENKENFKTDCLVAPSNVTIYITDFCHKRCRHCATESHNRIKKEDELKFNDWVKVIHQLREAGVFMIIISGGEPFALPYIHQLLKTVDELRFGLTLLTDFDNFTEKDIDNLKSLKRLVNIQTSLDGATAATHDFLRGKGSFLKTLARLEMFSKAKLDFSVAVAVHKKNIGELDQIAQLATKYGASSVYLNAIAPYGRAKNKMKDFLLDDKELKQMAQTCLRWAAEGKIGVRNPFWKENLHYLGSDEYNPFAGTLNAMSLGVYNFSISSKGDCYLDSKQRAEKMLNLGNIVNDNLIEMWNDSRLSKLRSLCSSEKFAYAEQVRVRAALGI